jgi:tetratricopeptide (TPR) repeat protein
MMWSERPANPIPPSEARVPTRPGGTLPPPEWIASSSESYGTPSVPPQPLPRRTGTRADEAWLRARVEEARAAGDTTALRTACTALARWLGSRDRNLDEAVELATTALSLGVDLELRREVSAWLESLGDPARAAAVLKPIATQGEGEFDDVAFVLIRTGVLKARAGAAAGAAAAFEAATSIDGDDPVAPELLGALSAWEPDVVSPAAAAEAYLEASRRHARLEHPDGEIEDVWRAFATDPAHEMVAAAVAEALLQRGRLAAADEVHRAFAVAIAPMDPGGAAAVHAARVSRAVGRDDAVGALAAALDRGAEREIEGAESDRFDALLVSAGMPEVLAARLELRAELAPTPADRARHWIELARLSAGSLADPRRAAAAYTAALATDPSNDAASAALQALATRSSRPPENPEASAVTAAARAWVRSTLSEDGRLRALSLERVASLSSHVLGAALFAVSSERYRALGDWPGARRTAEAAVLGDPDSARAVSALAEAVVGDRDATAALALERAVSVVGPRLSWCAALAEACDALGQYEAAVNWTQRCVTLRPGDRGALEKLLERMQRAGDAGRLGDALAWTLSQPLPVEAIAGSFARALRELARLDSDRAAVVARRALDVFGPRSPALRDAMLEAAARARDVAFTAAILERWLACGADGVDRRRLIVQLADLREQLGDDEGEARMVARAVREGLSVPEIDAHVDRLAGRPASPDAQLWRMSAEAFRASRAGDSEAAAWAWRELGGALWDLADDHVGAIAAWQRVARSPHGGGRHTAFALDLVTFGGPEFAFEYLTRLVESEGDDRAAAAIAADAARAALLLGDPRRALDFGTLGVTRCPWYGGALEASEMAVQRSGDHEALSALYDFVASRALGRFGRRAAHYRGARFFERHTVGGLALRHAAKAFQSLPSEGSTLHLLARAAARAGDHGHALSAIEQVARTAPSPAARAGWLLRAAAIAGEGDAESLRRKVDVLVQAAVAVPSAATIALLDASARALLSFEPDERAALEIRFARAARSAARVVEGPEGARIALAFARTSLDVFDDGESALASIERAFACDADVEEFALLIPKAATVARSPRAAEVVGAMLTASEAPHANVGAAALQWMASVASALGDPTLRGRAAVAAAVAQPDDDVLVAAAEEVHRTTPELAARFVDGVPPARRVEALLSAARARVAAGAHGEAAAYFERALALVDGTERTPIERELRACWDASGRQAEVEQRVRTQAADQVASPQVRAARWMEVAERREGRRDLPGAVQALLEACKLDPGPLERWSALERVAEEAGNDEVRIRALKEIVERVGAAGQVAVFKRLARAYEVRGELEPAEGAWLRVQSLDPGDEEADQSLERLIASRGEDAKLAEHLARRVARLGAEPGTREMTRAVRLRRAALLERLGRVDDACAELTRLLEDTPDHSAALRYLADLLERRGEPGRAATLWLAAARAAIDVGEREQLELRAGRAFLASGDAVTAVRIARQLLAGHPESESAAELGLDAARVTGSDRDLGGALEAMARTQEPSPMAKSDLLVEAAMVAARAGDLDEALERARRAAEAAPERATPQLLARGLEYRLRGPGTPEEASLTIAELQRINEPIAPDDTALRSFLLAEALDVAQDVAAGLAALEEARTTLGDHPLVALGLAERQAKLGDHAAAVQAYRIALSGPLLDLRRPGRVAMAAAEASVAAKQPDDAILFLDFAEEHSEVRALAKSMRAKLTQASRPQSNASVTDLQIQDLERAVRSATTPVERAQARLSLGRSRLEKGDLRSAEPVLWEALADGLIEAGDLLAAALAPLPDRTRDVVRIRRQQVGIEPGDLSRLESLRDAALADDADAYAQAIEHVLRAFDRDALAPPPLAMQQEQPGIFALLVRPSLDAAGEALALVWEGAMQLFVKDAASYSVTGLERVVPGPTSAIARLYEIAVRVLGAPRIPLFLPRSAPGLPATLVALLSPPSVVLTGDVQEETPALRYALGQGMSAALPQNALRLGLPAADGRSLVNAMRAAFGPPETGRIVDSRAARLAESFWQLVPPRAQRRLQQLLGSAPLPDYEELVSRAKQSGRRVGLFFSGDFGYAAQSLLAEFAPQPRGAPSIRSLRGLCQEHPMLADLLRLAVSSEYAQARWHAASPVVQRGAPPTGRFSLF